jgi:O-antigen/teichoic acid export membrane protein
VLLGYVGYARIPQPPDKLIFCSGQASACKNSDAASGQLMRSGADLAVDEKRADVSDAAEAGRTGVSPGLHQDKMWRTGGIPVNTIVTAARTLIRALTSLAMLPLLITRIGADATGLFIIATTLTGYFNSVEYGLGTSVTKYVAEHRATGDAEQLGSVLRASLLLMMGLGLLIAVIIALFGLVGGPALFGASSVGSAAQPTLLVTAGIALFYWPSRLGTATLEGLERYDVNAIVQSVSSILTLALIYVASGWTHSVPVLTGIFCTMLVFEGLCAGALAWPNLGLRRGLGRWRGDHLRPSLGFGTGLFIIGFSSTLIYESDRIVVTAVAGAAAVVTYEIALRPHSGVRQINGLTAAAMTATCSRLVAEDRPERLRRLVLAGSLYAVVLTIPFAVLTIVLARPILEAWVGPSYGQYAIDVQIFVSYWLVTASGALFNSAIVGIGRIRVLVWITAIIAVLTLGLSIGLAVALGTVGVILGTVIPACISTPLSMPYYLRHIGISKASFAREVLIPGYAPVALWTIPVLVGARALHPSGLIGIGAFCATALVLLGLVYIPILRASWRSIGSADEGSAAPQPQT